MSRAKAIAYAIGLHVALLALLFGAAGWLFVALTILAFGISALVLVRVNPVIYRARSRFQPGTKNWVLPAALAAAVLVLRTAWEDRLLRTELTGYDDYVRRVRWRLVPGLW